MRLRYVAPTESRGPGRSSTPAFQPRARTVSGVISSVAHTGGAWAFQPRARAGLVVISSVATSGGASKRRLAAASFEERTIRPPPTPRNELTRRPKAVVTSVVSMRERVARKRPAYDDGVAHSLCSRYGL